MSPAEFAFWQLAQRRALGLTPDVAAAILRAFQIVRDSLSDTELTRIVSSGQLDQLYTVVLSDAVLDRAFLPVRDRIYRGVADNVKYFARQLPNGGKVNGTLTISFDILNPKVIDAVRALDTKVIGTLQEDVRETVRAFVENGLRDGVNPRQVAREIRDVVGLAPNQEVAVRNFRKALEGGEGAPNPLTYKLRNKRFDRTIAKGKLTPEQIDKMVDAYRKRMIAHNAETNARTAALDSMKLGQRLSWEDAAAKGIVDRSRLTKRWVGVKDDRERPEHLAMEGQTVGFDAPFSNGEMIPGDSTYNCRCIAIYSQARR